MNLFSRYGADFCPSPDYRNPKLLSQFVSPHTGLVYDVHITGLCEAMQVGCCTLHPAPCTLHPAPCTLHPADPSVFPQERVKLEVSRSQSSGFMSTRVKPLHYLQDPQLFNSSRPVKPNPF